MSTISKLNFKAGKSRDHRTTMTGNAKTVICKSLQLNALNNKEPSIDWNTLALSLVRRPHYQETECTTTTATNAARHCQTINTQML